MQEWCQQQYNVLHTCKCKSHSNYIRILTSQIFVHRMLFAIISTNSCTYLCWNEHVEMLTRQ